MPMLGRDRLIAVGVGLALLLSLGCAPVAPGGGQSPSPGAPLRVGVSSNSPPFVLRQGDRLTGLEIDFALALARALGRPLRLVDLEWREQVPALLDGRTDIIMSGMSVTRARAVRIAFSDPYLNSGQLALFRRADARRYRSRADVLATGDRVGVIEGTTGEKFVRENLSGAAIAVYPTVGDAVTELLQRRIDLVVHDAPILLWSMSANEGDLDFVRTPLNEEQLAWGLRQNDENLRTAVDGVLARWRADGTLDQNLTRWLPYWQKLEREVGTTR
jgi:polar amino acid transport system substrate-binding protein